MQNVTLIRSCSADRLNAAQKTSLRELCQHFGIDIASRNTENGSEETGEEAGRVSPSKRKRKRKSDEEGDDDDDDDKPAPKRRNQWKPIVDLKELVMPKAVLDMVKQHGENPETFLQDAEMLENGIVAGKAKTSGDIIFSILEYSENVEGLAGLNVLRWAYSMLGFYDFMKRLFPQTKSAKMGPRMVEAVVDCRNSGGPGASRQALSDGDFGRKLQVMYKCGFKLDILCNRFGDGCIFFLSGIMSQDL